MKIRLAAFVAVATALVSSCTQVQPSVYGTFDAREKTIAVPVTNLGAIPTIKNNLRKAGWDIRVSGANASIQNGMAATNATSRYTMALEVSEVHGSSLAPIIWYPPVTLIWLCSGCPKLTTDYRISATVYDNRDGREMLTYAGFIKTGTDEPDILTETIVKNTR